MLAISRSEGMRIAFKEYVKSTGLVTEENTPNPKKRLIDEDPEKERLMYYNVCCFSRGAMSKKSVVITMRLSQRDFERIEAVRALEKVERSTLLKEFIENGLSERVIHLYRKGKLTAGRAAEILGVPLREFLEKLEEEGVPVNWNSESVKEYLKARYGESSVAKSDV